VRAAKDKMKEKYFDDIVKLDTFRSKRTGIHEFIFAKGKKSEVVSELLYKMAKINRFSAAVKASSRNMDFIRSNVRSDFTAEFYEDAGMIVMRKKGYKLRVKYGPIGILTAGTSDVAVAEEARITACVLGCGVIHFYDVGVAGIHRLISPLKNLIKLEVRCIIVIAGMDGVLPTLVRGLVDIPVIGVPASGGYGYGKDGESALMSMLQSCSPGLVVVNIDNGFGAAAAAYLIAKQRGGQ